MPPKGQGRLPSRDVKNYNVNTAIAHRSSDSVFSYLTGMRTSWDGKQNSSTSLRGYEFELSHLGTMQGADL